MTTTKGLFRLLFPLGMALAAIAISSGCREGEQEHFKTGVAVAEITPPVGYYHYRGISTGVRDPLYAKAIVFEQGDTRGALLICDIIGIPRDLSVAVRKLASQKTGIPFENISITATHTHTGPSIREPVRRWLAPGPLETETTGETDDYIPGLVERMAGAITQAAGITRKTECFSGISQVTGLSFNRRFLMTDGKVRFNPGINNPAIVRTTGPVDPDLHYLLFRYAGQEDFSFSLSVFANHLDTEGGTEYGADYPYYFQKYLREHFGEQFISLFGTGTCGNLNHINVAAPSDESRRHYITNKIGRELASAIVAGIPTLKRGDSRLEVVSSILYLPLQDLTPGELEWALDNSATPLYTERPFLTERRRMKILDLNRIRQTAAIPPSAPGEPWRLPVEIHIFRIDSETAIVTLPGEVFVELGLAIKQGSPFANTMVIELANLDIAYIPTLEAFSEGDYEAINSRLAPGSGERMVEEALKILKQL